MPNAMDSLTVGQVKGTLTFDAVSSHLADIFVAVCILKCAPPGKVATLKASSIVSELRVR